MHELSIANSLLDRITERLIEHDLPGQRVAAVTVEIGKLSGVVPTALRSAFLAVTRGTELQRCQLHLVEIDVRGDCPRCRQLRPVRAPDLMVCAFCGQPITQVVQGRELELVALEVLDEPTAHS